MPPITSYTDSLQTGISAITGRNAPKTGEYYSKIYTYSDPDTGMPVLVTELNIQNNAGPVPLGDLQDVNMLDLVLIDPQTLENPPDQLTVSVDSNRYMTSNQEDILIDGGGLPLFGSIVFILLIGLVWFVYSIIRIWQNNQSQRAIIHASVTGVRPMVETPSPRPIISIPKSDSVPAYNINIEAIEKDMQGQDLEKWRESLERLDMHLDKLLTRKNISGETIEDKLGSISAGEFSSVDIAWEAHQTAKNLLSMHDEQLETQDLTRVLKLFKQVFAEHGLI